MEHDHKAIAQMLRKHKTFKTLSEEALTQISSVSRMIEVAAGTLFIREGEESKDLYVLMSGSAAAVRDSGDGELIVLSSISAGDCIGELAFLDDGRRTASVRAETPCTLIDIPAAAIQRLPDAPAVLGELKGALASVVVNRARTMSDEMLASLRRQLEFKTLQIQFGHFLVFTVALLLFSSVLFYHVAQDHVEDIYDPGFSWQTILFLGIPCLIIIKVLKIPLSELGIKRVGLWKSFYEALVVCLIITVPFAVYYFGFWDGPTNQTAGVSIDAFFVVQYFVHVFLQEIGARGLLQGLFQKFLDDAKGHRSVFLASTIFASLHLTFGIDAVIVTFFASFIFGYVYLRQKNLLGVTMIHYWLGLLAALAVAF